MSWKDDSYTVGYGKPPASGRFQKGKFGNPNGRPRGTRNFSTDLEEVLSKKVTVVENGKKRKVSTQMATMQRLCEKAMQGDARSVELYLRLAAEQAHDIDAQNNEQALGASDVQIIENHFEFLQAQSSTASAQSLEDENDG